MRQYRLTGENLEMIQKLGWEEGNPVDVSNLPAPIPGPGLKQSLEISLPDPPNPGAVLLVWLRGTNKVAKPLSNLRLRCLHPRGKRNR